MNGSLRARSSVRVYVRLVLFGRLLLVMMFGHEARNPNALFLLTWVVALFS